MATSASVLPRSCSYTNAVEDDDLPSPLPATPGAVVAESEPSMQALPQPVRGLVWPPAGEERGSQVLDVSSKHAKPGTAEEEAREGKGCAPPTDSGSDPGKVPVVWLGLVRLSKPMWYLHISIAPRVTGHSDELLG